MRYFYLILILILVTTSSCSKKIAETRVKDTITPSTKVLNEEEQYDLKEEKELKLKAERLSKAYIITDGHIDLPYRLRVQNFKLEKEYLGIPIETEKGDFDHKRAKQGGLDAPFMSIFVPASAQKDGTAKVLADTLIDMVTGIIDAHPQHFAYGRSVAEVKENFTRGLVSLPMGMENGAPIMDDLDNVDYFHDRGIRYITLTHSKVNQICDSSYDTLRTWNGLSPFGVEVVKRMNQVGIMVDISHVSDSTFYQVMHLSAVPCIASHSSVRKYVPDFERNMSDDMLKLLGEKGGVIQINFGSTFLDGQLQKNREAFHITLRDKLKKEHNMVPSDPGAMKILEAYAEEDPRTFYSDVSKVADHIDHVVRIAGIDHVGFGSDYDGVGDTLPTGLKDVASYPNLIYELLRRGYSEEDIEKICYKNVFRVWSAVEEYAAKYKD